MRQMSELPHPGGRKKLQTNPTTIPGSVMVLGRILCCRSVMNSTISAQANTTRTRLRSVSPYVRYVSTNTSDVMISTEGYIHDTVALHVRQRPRSTTQLITGTLSNQLKVRPHDVQRDAG